MEDNVLLAIMYSDLVVSTRINMFALKLIFCVTVCVIGSRASQLPDFIKPCSRSLPKKELTNCITTQSRAAQSYFAKGMPQYDMPSLDPLHLNEAVRVEAGTFTIKTTNAVLKGLGNVLIKEVEWDLEKLKGHLILFGNMTMVGDYEVDGRILLVPLQGTGKLTVHMYNTEIKINFKLRTNKGKDDVDHREAFDIKATQNFGSAKFRLTNLLGGGVIGENINALLNENYRDIIEEVGPAFVKTIATKVNEIVNTFYSHIPVDELLE